MECSSSMETVNDESKQTTTPTPPSPPAGAGHAGVGGDAPDLISGLCDDVLARIVGGGGDAAELVRTGVLSRRWRGLWTRAPAFRFDSGADHFQSPGDAERFAARVNRVLALHAGGMERLRITLSVHYAPGEPRLAAATVRAVEGWIRYALWREVTSFALMVRVLPKNKKYLSLLDKYGRREEEEEDNYSTDDDDDEGDDDEEVEEEDEEDEEDSYGIDDEGDNDDDEETPEIDLDELPSSAKLETMRLFLGGARVRLPSSTSPMFTSLNDLTLECLDIVAADDDSAGDLLGSLLSSASCPRLQKLRLQSVTLNLNDDDSKPALAIESSTLLELAVDTMRNLSSLDLRAPNLRALEIESCDDLEALKVSSASSSRLKELTLLSCDRLHEVGIHGGHLPCVELLRISLVSHVSSSHDDDAVISILQSCSSATRLVVDLDVPAKLERHVDGIEEKMPALPNVTSLSVNIFPPPFERRHCFGNGVAGLLTRFNNLRYLCIEMEDDYFSEEEDADGGSPFFCTHECEDRWIFSEDISLAHLVTAEFRGLAGTSCELRFLRFMLESAMDLEKVTVRFSVINNSSSEEDRVYFLQELLDNDGAWTETACEEDGSSYEWRL